MLVGRDGELAVISGLLADAHQGCSGVLVISGEAGIGKSYLLKQVLDLSAGPILSTVGVEGESDIPFANLADVFRPVHSVLAEIPQRQAAALASVLAIGPPAPADRFAVAVAALSTFGALAGRGPLVVTVDDAQWVDRASLDVLTFVARRLEAEGVVMIFAMREGAAGSPVPQLDHFPRMRLGGLDDVAARQLVRGSATRPLSEPAITRLISEAGGNPLALRELPKHLTPAQLALWMRGMSPLPIDSLLEKAFCGSAQDLPAATQDALLLLATLGGVPQAVLDRALRVAGLEQDALDPAEKAGLINEIDGSLVFRHPLVRSAIYQTASSGERRRAHLYAAEALARSASLGSLERRAWHLIAAGESEDEELAATLDKAASAEADANNFAVASILFQRSAQLTPVDGPAAWRLVQAADNARLSGDILGAADLLQQALPLSGEPGLSTAIRYYLLRIAVWTRDPVAGRDDLMRLAAAVEVADPDQAVAILTDAALVSVQLGQFSAALEASARALTLVAAAQNGVPLSAAVLRALVLAAVGNADGAHELLDGREQEVDTVDPLTTELSDQLPLMLGLVPLVLEDVERATQLLERAVGGARQRSAAGVLPFRLGRLASAYFWRGRWSAGEATAHEALTLADDTGWVSARPDSLTTLARIEAATGRADQCRRHATEALLYAEAVGTRPHLAYAHAALGLLELTLSDYRAAIDQFEAVAELTNQMGIVDSPLVWWSSDLIEAYLQEGLDGPARDVWKRLAESAACSRTPTARAVTARCRALLEPHSYEAHLTEALRWHARSSVPFEHARTQLLFGAELRRARKRAAAQQQLRSALATFDRLGAAQWAQRARIMLGSSPVAPSDQGTGHLTPQELQVALAAARGLANREIAADLFLSVKTVEFHLSNVFHKLGINRRAKLAAMFVTQ